MKNANVASRKFAALLKKIGTVEPPAFPNPQDPVSVLVVSFLLWESTSDKALNAYGKIMEQVVDTNDLRVSMPHEIVDYIGPRYPRALDRAQRLRAVLRNVYLREHAMNLEKLLGSGKREARKYIESLEGIVPYVASRVLLLCFDTHAIPVDDQLRTQLIEVGVSDPSVENVELGNWLATQVKAGEGPAAHYALQCWVDEQIANPSNGEKRSGRKSGGRKSTAKV